MERVQHPIAKRYFQRFNSLAPRTREEWMESTLNKVNAFLSDDRIRERNPYWSDYICFAGAVAGRKFSKRTISYYFRKLVDKNDYAKGEKGEILKHLFELSSQQNIAEDCIF